jgi:hypothetical protein
MVTIISPVFEYYIQPSEIITDALEFLIYPN